MIFLGPQLCHPMTSFLNHVFQNVLCNLLKHHPSKTLNKHTHTHTHTHSACSLKKLGHCYTRKNGWTDDHRKNESLNIPDLA